jgi:glycosyltransferase involved in cell wall biosynthesis
LQGDLVKIGYLVNTYPRASHSFIRREIHALERAAVSVHRFAMRSDRAALVDPADLAEDDLTEHVLNTGLHRLAPTALKWLAQHPAQTLTALRLALTCGQRGAGGSPGTGGRARHMIYLIEAAYIAARSSTLGLTHIHAHFGTNSTTVAMLAHALGGPTYSFTTHGPEEFDAPHALALDLKLQNATFAVAISSFGRSQLCRWTPPANWPKIHVVHCGIEPALFAASPLPPSPDLVAIGRLSGQKGFALLVEAVAIATRTLPDLHLTLVGDGDLRPQIAAAIARHGLTQNITLTGWQSEQGVRTALNNATALILPSFAEGLPVVIMEAMAAARPIIATSIAGIPELVTADCGWLVPAGDAQALATAIETLAATPQDTLTQMGQTACARVRHRHNIDTEVAKLRALFAQLPRS